MVTWLTVMVMHAPRLCSLVTRLSLYYRSLSHDHEDRERWRTNYFRQINTVNYFRQMRGTGYHYLAAIDFPPESETPCDS